MQEKPLYHNLSQGIIISNMSLVLQRVGRAQSGIYTCVAHNSEGDGVSNPITLNVRYRPLCSPEQVMVYGVARLETVLVSCEVVSNPASGLRFHWVYNTSGETVQLEQGAVKVEGSRALVEYPPALSWTTGPSCAGLRTVSASRVSPAPSTSSRPARRTR